MENYEGLEENLERFKNDLTDEKTRLLFSIAYKQGYDQALSIANVSNQRELLLAYSEWWDKKYSPQRKDFHRHKDVDRFLSQ